MTNETSATAARRPGWRAQLAARRAPAAAAKTLAPFRDNADLQAQIGDGLTKLQADFARALAMSAWALHAPVRMSVLGLPAHATLDEALLEGLRRTGWHLDALHAGELDVCWDSRWEFVAANGDSPACYRPGPSYHERLRLELLLDAWERASLRFTSDGRRLDSLAEALAQTSAAFSSALALPIALLHDVAAERRAEVEAERRLRRGVREALAEFAEDDIRHLVIAGALDGRGDADKALRRYGSESMRRLLDEHRAQTPRTDAREKAEPLLANLRRNLWAPCVETSQAHVANALHA